MVRSAIVLAALFFCAASGCSSPVKKACGPQDAGVFEVGLEAPVGCPPAEANELGIGKVCTMCGNECESPLRCTCDSYLGVQLAGVPCVCTKIQVAPTGSTDPCASTAANFCGTGSYVLQRPEHRRLLRAGHLPDRRRMHHLHAARRGHRRRSGRGRRCDRLGRRPGRDHRSIKFGGRRFVERDRLIGRLPLSRVRNLIER